MEIVTVNLGKNSYRIFIDYHHLPLLGKLMQELTLGKNVALITDSRVSNLHGNRVMAVLREHGYRPFLISVPEGEDYKSLATATGIYDELIARKMDRRSPILALGGGVIGDLAGFVAGTFLRGVPFLQIPTTLLAQVDSSIGGKMAVDHPRGKNLIGCFYQPRLVFVELDFLSTLPLREFIAGLAEVVKYGLIADRSFFEYLEQHRFLIQNRNPAVIGQVVTRCCEIKADFVEKDEKEEIGVRTILNYGHTLGHALETVAAYRGYSHGEAVALGMVFASQLSVRLGLMKEEEQKRLVSLLKDFGLPVQLPKVEVDSLLKTIEYDKKVISGEIQFVLTKGIGHAIISREVSLDIIRELLIQQME